MDVLLEKWPDDWWTQSLLANVGRRKAAHKDAKAQSVATSLCDVCSDIDFEYFFFGHPETGFRNHIQEGLFLGTLADVKVRAVSGCDFCNAILVPKASKILEIRDPRLQDTTSRRLLADGALSVHLCASDIIWSREALSLQRSTGLFVELRNLSAQILAPEGRGAIVDEWEQPFPAAGPTSGNYVCLVDHELSVFKSLQPYVDPKLGKTWLDKCFQDHNLCHEDRAQQNRSQVSSHNPKFKLIDVETKYVVEFPHDAPDQYATLSYVCGKGYLVSTSSKSAQWEIDPIMGCRKHPLPDQLPNTVRDAMIVTKGLGLRHLWIDSLCISQDDEMEKYEQIRSMYPIYANATICIVAANGADSSAGLQGVGEPRHNAAGSCVSIRDGVSIGIPRQALSVQLEPYTWMKRAWTYQELILSKRCLLFMETEMFFYCASSTLRESQVEDFAGKQREEWSGGASNAFRIGNSTIMQLSKTTGQAAEICRMYVAAVEEYSRRDLSYQSDGLNAFVGLSVLLRNLFDGSNEHQDGGPAFGIPRAIIVNALTWRPMSMNAPRNEWPARRMMLDGDDGETDRHRRPLFPSWTWVAWKGHCRIQSFPYFFWSSELRLLYPGPEYIVLEAEKLKFLFATIFTQDLLSRHQKFMVLPCIARIAKFSFAKSEDADGHFEIFSASGEYAGSCDFRGHLDGEQISMKDTTFAQIWVEHRNGKGSHCNVMMIQNHAGDLNSENKQRLERWAEIATQRPPLQSATAQEMNDDPKFQMKMEGICPPELRVGHHVGKKWSPSEVLLVTRIGIGNIDYKKWLESCPQEALILLG